MRTYLLPSNNILEFVTKLSETGPVFYPILEDKNVHMVKFNKDKDFSPVFTKIRSVENIKHFLFPSRDVVAKFPKDRHWKSEQQFLFGIKSCDLRGIDVYDRVFLNWDPVDPIYRQRRENTTIISMDCPEPEDCCFCTLVGLNPYGESVCDINCTPLSSGLFFEIFTERGQEIIDRMPTIFKEVSKDEQKERDRIRKQAIKMLGKINDRSFKVDLSTRVENAAREVKREARSECVECHACLHVCPTCYCFLLSDHKKGKDIERVRTWDACYYAAYARVGGGANPHYDITERFWNRFLCKFSYFNQYEGFYACSGCGRCYRGCSGKIDIREILWKL